MLEVVLEVVLFGFLRAAQGTVWQDRQHDLVGRLYDPTSWEKAASTTSSTTFSTTLVC